MDINRILTFVFHVICFNGYFEHNLAINKFFFLRLSHINSLDFLLYCASLMQVKYE